MTDVHDKATRSYNMSRIRSRDTKPERILRKLLWQGGLRGYRLTAKLPGRPDIVFSRAKVAVFIDGCFWHGCKRCCGRKVTTNAGYWGPKIEGNRLRDRRTARKLRRMGWTVLRIWEHEVEGDPQECVSEIREHIEPYG